MNYRKTFHLLLIFLSISSALLTAQDGISYEISIQQAVDTAVANNLLLKNAGLQADFYKAGQKKPFPLHSLDVDYHYGEINSAAMDYYIKINSNFGSIVTLIHSIRKSRLDYQYEAAAFEITLKKLKAEVKSSYLFYQYQKALLNIRQNEAVLYDRIGKIYSQRYDSGEIVLEELIKVDSRVSEVKSRYLNTMDDLAIAGLQLQQLLMSDKLLLPKDEDAELYEIVKSDNALRKGDLLLSYYESGYKKALAGEAVAKSGYFPEINAGFFTQQIDGSKGYNGLEIGLSVPIRFHDIQSEITQARIQTFMAQNELRYHEKKVRLDTEILIYTLNKNFRLIRYYTNDAIPHAMIIYEDALAILNNDPGFEDFDAKISEASQIEEGYLNALNEYNQAALQLEIFE